MQTNVQNKTNEELEALKREIASLKAKLSSVIKSKEEWFLKKEQLKTELHNLVNKLRGVKKEKGMSDSSFSELKKQRDFYNNKVKSLIGQLKGLRPDIPTTDLKVRRPELIKELIDKLELTIETEAISFKKEKEIMEKIKKLRKDYKASLEIFKNSVKIKELSKEIDIAKRKSREYHKKLKEVMGQQKDYSGFINLSQRILTIRKKQEDAFNTFIKFKNEFKTLSNLLRSKQKSFKAIMSQVMNVKKQQHMEKQKQINKQLEEKRKIVDEKLKSGKKITTEDLVAYQDVK